MQCDRAVLDSFLDADSKSDLRFALRFYAR